MIFTHSLYVLALNKFNSFAMLQSSIYDAWTRKQSSTQETRLRYAPTDCFETMPLPDYSDNSSTFGANYSELRSQIMRQDSIGLTNLYNSFHNASEYDSKINKLRELHREIDIAVACSYGWDDLDLGHGFHEVPYLPEADRIRFTISEPARIEALRRLSELNRQRYEEEVRQGLHNV
jgi:hypothetical protein